MYSPEQREIVIAHLCEEISKGRALAAILREDDVLPVMPSVTAVWEWSRNCIDFSERIERAREQGADALVSEMVDIADESSTDVYVEHDKDGTPRAKVDGDVIQRAKLRIYAREQYAKLIAPKRFGSKLDVTSGGDKLPAPVTLQDNRVQSLIAIALQRKADEDQLKQLMDD